MVACKSGLAVLAVLTLMNVPMQTVRAEEIGTSCADCPSYDGAFSISNDTGALIHYQMRWGNRANWKRIELPTGRLETHRYPLGSDAAGRAPIPFVRFDDVADDHRVTFREYRMEFHAVGYAGYGPKVNRTEPKRYHFEYSADRRHLDLKAS